MRLTFIDNKEVIQEVRSLLDEIYEKNKSLFRRDFRRDIFLSVSGKKNNLKYNFLLYKSEENIEDYNTLLYNFPNIIKQEDNYIKIKNERTNR